MVSHFHWSQKQIGAPNSPAADCELLSDPPPPHCISPSPPGCLDRLFICPAWARKGYCDSKRKLMQKHCPSSCDFCYGKMQQQQRENKKKSSLSLSPSIEQSKKLFANRATGANRSSHAELPWGFAST